MSASSTSSTPDDPLTAARRHWDSRGWSDATPGMAALTSVVRTGHVLRARVDAALEPFALTFARYEVLALLKFARARSLPMSRVSSRLQVQPASMTHTVRRLEQDGLLARFPNPRDGRGTLIGITDEGIALVHAATPHLNTVFLDLGLAPEEAEQLIRLCTRLLEHHEQPRDGGPSPT